MKRRSFVKQPTYLMLEGVGTTRTCRQPGQACAESHPLHAAILSLGTEDTLRRSYLRKCWQGRLSERNLTGVSTCRRGHSPDSASPHHLTDTAGPLELEPA
jgi:hypothetical protein